MKLQTAAGLVGKYLLAVVAIAICGAVLIYYSPSPFRIQLGWAVDGHIRQWDESWPVASIKWSAPDPNSAWYKFILWAMSPPGSLLVALPVTLLSSREVLEWVN